MSFSHCLVDENRGVWTFTPLTTGLFDDRWYTKPALYFYQKDIIEIKWISEPHPYEQMGVPQ